MKKNILVLGASGMLGNSIMRYFSEDPDFNVFGTVRNLNNLQDCTPNFISKLIVGVDADSMDSIVSAFIKSKPDIVVNCIGLVKQLSLSDDPLTALPINAILPHRLAALSAVSGARFIHISTDCVFSGNDGMYVETDITDAKDLYGISKRLGEVSLKNSVTLRTSIIGHELAGKKSLVDWFLSQNDEVNGYSEAIFSGLPTVEIAHIIKTFVIPNVSLTGIYHVSAEPINKYDLLILVANIYQKNINIVKDNRYKIDRSLDSTRFKVKTNYSPPSWPQLIKNMFEFM